MNSGLYILALILVAIWAIGFFAYAPGNAIHIVLGFAILTVIIQLIRG
jgi:hypothetical protein